MKKIYFVRHGATGGNEKDEFQLPTIPLSDMGLKQAEFVAERFKTIPVDTIIASDMKRASQTAEAISKTLNKKITYQALFQEILRPSFVRGKRKDDPEVMKIMEEVKANFDNQNYHHSDEENYFDLKNRAVKCLEYLQSLQEENILVVTHGQFLNMLIGIMELGDTMTPKQFKLLQKFFIAKNTGITIVEEYKGNFFLLTWNDYTHLGDTDIKYIPS
ncbi:MAG: histidine phosphatase family protein [bacterium]